ncbi:MAG: FAD-binding oxidoreductase, partial [Lentisphaerota bacterium]
MHPGFEDYLHDESRKTGQAEHILFPKAENEVQNGLSSALVIRESITIQGARTGITGGAVPAGGLILNLSRMDRLQGLRRSPDGTHYLLSVQPGVVLSTLRAHLQQRDFDLSCWGPGSLSVFELFKKEPPHFFTPDPTETTATLGGMIACNASGARSFLYGPTRR